MNTKLQKELTAVARRHGYLLEVGCAYCGHKSEVVGNRIDDHPVTFLSVRPLSKPVVKKLVDNLNRCGILQTL